MLKFYLGFLYRNSRRVKFYFGCLLFCAIFLIKGYSRESRYSDATIISTELEGLTNRRHNRNLQHLYSQDSLTEHKKDLKVKINNDQIRRDNFLIEHQNKRYKKENVTTDNTDLNSRHKNFTKSLPQAIIIGVKKGGTRALLEFLRAHPNVRATGPEPHFFDKNYEKGLEWYRNLMPESEPSQLTIEKTPGYFITSEVPKRIYNMSISVKLIVVVRDPVTRAISDFAQITSKSAKPQSFETVVLKNNESAVDTSKTIVKVGMYSEHLEKWLKYFHREQFHFVNGENLVTDPGSEMIKLQEFLNLPVLITHKHFYFNKSRGFPCIRKKPNKKPHCLDETKGRRHPNINSEAINSLREFYRPFNLKFSTMVGQEFGWS